MGPDPVVNVLRVTSAMACHISEEKKVISKTVAGELTCRPEMRTAAVMMMMAEELLGIAKHATSKHVTETTSNPTSATVLALDECLQKSRPI